MCDARGIVAAASVVDHVVPHKDDPVLFWDEANWQPLCKALPRLAQADARAARQGGAARELAAGGAVKRKAGRPLLTARASLAQYP